MRAPKRDKQTPEPEDATAPEAPDAPRLDTSTDWDEWMERQAGRPAADAEGRFPVPPREKPQRE